MTAQAFPGDKTEVKLSRFYASDTLAVIHLFTKVFSASENDAEGEIIGNLVSDLIRITKSGDLMGFVATSGGRIVGCIFFSRMIVPVDVVAFILSPVAIATSKQGTGIGQRLIRFGLDHLRTHNVQLVFTYGDPAYYSKTGFNQINESIVQAPFELSQPEGWLAQSLDGKSVKAMQGPSKCVEALSDQKYW